MAQTNGYTVFIIEDEETIRKELKILLEKHGYHVKVAEDFAHVARVVLDEKPHLVLLDLNLPIYDGHHICREIRSQSTVPILVVTSRDGDVDELMSISLGADDFVTKPYNTQILLARMASLLNRTYQMDSFKKISHAGMTLDVGKGVLECGGGEVELTKNELRILELLMREQGGVVSRDDMMNELWQSDEFVDDNTLTVNINRLRKKLAEVGAQDCLKTKRGRGYSLEG